MDLSEYRQSASELERTGSLEKLMSEKSDQSGCALDIGARDGHFSLILANYFREVTALDLERPNIEHAAIKCVKGDLKKLEFQAEYFDLVFCAEVLEHIPGTILGQACDELARVTKKYLVIGVPYRQDTRVGKTTCRSCGDINPPWGHVNSFDTKRLEELFSALKICRIEYVGSEKSKTNFISSKLMDFAGNPYGTYDQEELCVHCGHVLIMPTERTILQKVATKLAVYMNRVQALLTSEAPIWVHVVFEK